MAKNIKHRAIEAIVGGIVLGELRISGAYFREGEGMSPFNDNLCKQAAEKWPDAGTVGGPDWSTPK